MNNKNYSLRWEITHSQIFSYFIKELNNNKIKYFVLRNFEGLPEINISKDIDIIIEPGSYQKSSELLSSTFKKFEISHFKVVKYERVRCWYGIDIEKNFSIHIDLIEGYLSKGFEVFLFETLYNNTVLNKEFRVLNSAFDALMLLYYKVIGTNELKIEYQNKISNIYRTDKVHIDALIKKTLNKSCSAEIITSLDTKNYPSIVYLAQSISSISKRKVFFRRPISTITNIFRFISEKFQRIIICPRRYQNFIAVLGADGTGKSTFIEGLTSAIAFYFVSEISKSHVYHHRPTLLPNLGTLGESAKIMVEDKDFTNPHRRKPASIISSFIRMTYYWLDYFIGVPIMLRKDVQFDRFTIYDRYIYDFIIDPHRSRINLPYFIRKVFSNLVVHPRIVFVLLTDAVTIYSRKQELTIDEINRQLVEFTKLAKTHKRFIVIDASKSPEEMVDDAMKNIIENFTTKL